MKPRMKIAGAWRRLTAGRGVYVVGMHRSGTSAVARVVNLLGLPIGDPGDLIEPDPPSNPKGHWESSTLATFNDRVLAAFGGAWSAPPELADGWEQEAFLTALGAEARAAFETVYAPGPWVWKDPRLCLTLPFWRRYLGRPAVALLVVRNPLEVARSLAARNRFPTAYSLALWERYCRSAVTGLQGMSVLVTSYESLVADPGAWCIEAARFLQTSGIRAAVPAAGVLEEFVDPGLRHASFAAGDLAAGGASPEQCELDRVLRSAIGPHPKFRVGLTTPVTEAAADLIGRHREAVVAARDPWLVPAG